MMNWFGKICRNTGLMVHHIIEPLRNDSITTTRHHEVKRTTAEKQIDQNVTLRRTTIDEIEMRHTTDPQS
jgi:hypothetical protein